MEIFRNISKEKRCIFFSGSMWINQMQRFSFEIDPLKIRNTPSELISKKAVLSVFRESVDAFLCFGTEIFHRVPPPQNRTKSAPNQQLSPSPHMDSIGLDALNMDHVMDDTWMTHGSHGQPMGTRKSCLI